MHPNPWTQEGDVNDVACLSLAASHSCVSACDCACMTDCQAARDARQVTIKKPTRGTRKREREIHFYGFPSSIFLAILSGLFPRAPTTAAADASQLLPSSLAPVDGGRDGIASSGGKRGGHPFLRRREGERMDRRKG